MKYLLPLLLLTTSATAQEMSLAKEENGKLEFDIQVDHHGTLSHHLFRLKWLNEQSSLEKITVIDSETSEILQTIVMPEGLQIPYNEIFIDTNSEKVFREKILDIVDYNFDNYGDLRLLKSWPITLSSKGYFVYIFHPLENKYILNEEISALPNPIPTVKSYRIESTTLGEWGGGEFTKSYYSIDQDGKLTIQAKWIQTIKDPIRMTFTRDVRTRLNGTLQRICLLDILSEGRAKVAWGDRIRCRKSIPHTERR